MALFNHFCKIVGILVVVLALTVLAHAETYQFNCSNAFDCAIKNYCQPNGIPALLVHEGKCAHGSCEFDFSSSSTGKQYCSVIVKTTAYGNRSGAPLQNDEVTEISINGESLGTTKDPYANSGDPLNTTFCGLYTQKLKGAYVELEKENTLELDPEASHGIVSIVVTCGGGSYERDCSLDIKPVIDPIPDKNINYTQSFSNFDLWNYIHDYDDSFADLNVSINVVGTSASCSFDQNRYLSCSARSLGPTRIDVNVVDWCKVSTQRSFYVNVTNERPHVSVPDYVKSCASNLHRLVELNYFSWDERFSDVNYVITSQSNPSLLNCWIDNNHYISCDVNQCADSYSDIGIRITDKFGLFYDDVFRITLKNFPPEWSTIPNQCINSAKSQIVNLKNYAYDLEDKNNLTFTLTQGDSTNVNCFLDSQHYVSCNNLSNQQASNVLTVKAFDSKGLSAQTQFIISTNCFEDKNGKRRFEFESENKGVCLERCTSYSSQIRVKNISRERACFDFQTETNPDELRVSLTNPTFCLNANEQTFFTLSANTCGAADGQYKVRVFDQDNNLELFFDYEIGTCSAFDGFRVEEFDGTICRGTTRDFSVVVTNTSSSTKTISLSAENPFLLPFFTPNKVTLSAGANKRVQVTINATGSSLGRKTVVLSGVAPNYVIEKKLSVEVVDCSDIKDRTFIINMPSVCYDVNKGQIIEGSFSVKCSKVDCCECSDDDKKINLQLFGMPGQLSYNTLDISCGRESIVDFIISVPQNAQAGINYVSVVGTDISNPFDPNGFTEEKQICLNVQKESKSSLLLRTQTKDILWCSSEIFELELINNGDLDENLHLSSANLPAGVSVSFSETNIVLKKGTTKVVYVSISTSPSSQIKDNQSVTILVSGTKNLSSLIYFNVKSKPSFDDLEFVSSTKGINMKANTSALYNVVLRNNSGKTLSNIVVSAENLPTGVSFESMTVDSLANGSTIVVSGKIIAGDVNGTYYPVFVVSSGTIINKKSFALVVLPSEKGSLSQGFIGSGTGFFGLFTFGSDVSLDGVIAAIILAIFLIVLISVIILVIAGLFSKPVRKEIWVEG